MLTARQRELLNAIINEFIETANAVGSIDLPEKYELDISSATIRNEMARLVDLGYLQKPHASSGRIPTTLAFRYFIQEIDEDVDSIDIRKQVALSEDFFQKRYNTDQLLISAVKVLNELTHNAAVAVLDDRIYHAGLPSLLDNPEFQNLNNLKQVLSVLEDYSDLMEIFSRFEGHKDSIKVLIGDEIGLNAFDKCAFAFADIPSAHGNKGYVAVLGPNRMDYRKVIPSLEYVSDRIKQMLSNWL